MKVHPPAAVLAHGQAHDGPHVEDYNYSPEHIPDSTAMQLGVEYAEGQYVKRDPDELTQVMGGILDCDAHFGSFIWMRYANCIQNIV